MPADVVLPCGAAMDGGAALSTPVNVKVVRTTAAMHQR